jgi:RimJ/RimL family protein N-acetyltransferase
VASDSASLRGPGPVGPVLMQTHRIWLRRFVPADARLLFELDSDPEVMRFITHGEPTPLRQIEEEILPRVLGYYSRTPPQGCWAAHLRGTGEFIGWFHLRADRISPREMELGYRLKRSAWGAGLATEGARALVVKGFSDWQSEKICARTLAGNAASQRVMEKAGLKFETAFVYGRDMMRGWTEEERKAVKYSLRREEFLRERGMIGQA